MEEMLSIIFIGVVVIGGYVLIARLLLRGVDYLRNRQNPRIDPRLHSMIRAIVLLLGISGVGVGGWVGAWCVFNLFWERQKEFQGGYESLETPIVMILFGVAMIRVAVNSKQPTRAISPEVAQPSLDG